MKTKLKIYGALLILMLFCQQTFAQGIANNITGTGVGSGPGANSSCTWYGDRASSTSSTGNYNTYIGNATGQLSTSGTQNLFVGAEAGYKNTSASYNVFIGAFAGRENTTGEKNTFVGTNAGKNTTTGSFNTFMGLNAGIANTTGLNNSFFGHLAGTANTTGSRNTFMGLDAGKANTTGIDNTFVGYISGTANTTGNYNTFFGDQSGKSNTTASYNCALGEEALYTNSTGANNTALGFQAMNLATAGNNTAVGYKAGNIITTGTNNTCLGYDADLTSNALTNATAIGNGAIVLASNTVQLGNGSSTGLYFGTGSMTASAGNVNLIYDVTTGQITRLSSSKRYKKDIVDIEINTSKIYDLRPVSFTSADNTADAGTRHFGLIAEEVAATIPELADYAREKDVIPGSTSEKIIPDAVKYSMLAILLLEEMKKHEIKINEQQKQLVQQSEKIEKQEKEIATLASAKNGNSNSTNILASSPSSIGVNLKDGQSVVLDQNVPNPFAEQTVISYFLPDNTIKAQMLFYNVEGKLIQSVDLKEIGKGSLNVFASDLSSGIYTYTLIVDGKVVETKKMIKQ